MAPRSEYILPQGIQSDISTANYRETLYKIDFNNEDNNKTMKLSTDLLAIDNVIQLNDMEEHQGPATSCPCHTPRVRRSLLPELESEAIRLSPAGPWFTLPRSQSKRLKPQRKKVNDIVKQKLFIY